MSARESTASPPAAGNRPAAGAVVLDCGDNKLDLSQPRVMGILNVTDDSFSDGGRYRDTGAAVEHAHGMVDAGAALIDVGGESTRPGAEPVPLEEELRRVVPVVRRLAAELRVPISVDTGKPEVMRAVADAGAGLINDVYGLRLPGAMAAAAATGLPVCVMHMQGQPRTMQQDPEYVDVVREVREFLLERMRDCEEHGIPPERLVLDPGFGFGKNDAHNLALLRHLPLLASLARPLLVGLSRKAMIGRVLGRAVGERTAGSIGLALAAVSGGARIVRVHDVAETVDALTLWWLVHGDQESAA